MPHTDASYIPVLLNGHRFGCVSVQRGDWLLAQGLPGVRTSGHGLSLQLDEVDQGLHAIHLHCARKGALRGWRDEPVDVLDWSGVLCLGQMERAAARFWGSHTRAVHLNAWVRCDDGHGLRLWVARRASTKATDPGMWDNLVAGGLGRQESPLVGLRREAQEEAGLDIAKAHRIDSGPTLKIDRPVEEGWQRESLHVLDAQLPLEFVPVNQDGEVQAFDQLDTAAALRLALSGQMTAEAAAVTLDFLRRQR